MAKPSPAQSKKDGATSPLKNVRTLKEVSSFISLRRSALTICVSIMTNTAQPRSRSINLYLCD